jgi:hypothetical protein
MRLVAVEALGNDVAIDVEGHIKEIAEIMGSRPRSDGHYRLL